MTDVSLTNAELIKTLRQSNYGQRGILDLEALDRLEKLAAENERLRDARVKVKPLEWEPLSSKLDTGVWWASRHAYSPDIEMRLEKTPYGWELFVGEESVIEPCDTLEAAKQAAQDFHNEQVMACVSIEQSERKMANETFSETTRSDRPDE